MRYYIHVYSVIYTYIRLKQTIYIRHFGLDLPYELGVTFSKPVLKSVQYGF